MAARVIRTSEALHASLAIGQAERINPFDNVIAGGGDEDRRGSNLEGR